MSDKPHCLLTSRDFAILETMRARMGASDAAFADLLRQKLETARVVLRDEIPAGVVTLDSRVTYRIDGRPAGTHLVAQGRPEELPAAALSIHTPRGLGLLGLSEGQSIVVESAAGRETLFVEAVNPAAPGGAQVVSFQAFRRAQPPAFADGPEDDDPGPQAA